MLAPVAYLVALIVVLCACSGSQSPVVTVTIMAGTVIVKLGCPLIVLASSCSKADGPILHGGDEQESAEDLGEHDEIYYYLSRQKEVILTRNRNKIRSNK